jgi:hypothetical protein
MVIGSKGKCLKSLQQEFGVYISAMKADHKKNLQVPYFLIEGDERSVLFAALKVHSLLSLSMGRSEKELKAKNEKLTKDNEELIGILHTLHSSPEHRPTNGSVTDELTDTIGCSKCYACVSGGSHPCQTNAM